MATTNAAHAHEAHFLACAKACADCQIQCDSCFSHCLMMLIDGNEEHAKTVQLCADCSECCKMCATLCARESSLAHVLLESCAKCCDECAAACEKIKDDKFMAACAKSCRDCAKACRDCVKSCRDMPKQLVH